MVPKRRRRSEQHIAFPTSMNIIIASSAYGGYMYTAVQPLSKSKGMNHAGDTTYKTHSHPNSTITKDSECIDISKDKYRHTRTHYKHKLGGRWKYRLGTVSNNCHWGFKPGLGAPNLTLIPSSPYKTYNVNKISPVRLIYNNRDGKCRCKMHVKQRHIKLKQAESTYRQCTP